MRRILVWVVLAFAAPARADGEDPWDVGVPIERQDEANALFAEGNKLFSERAHAPALVKYKAAVAIWNHPMIQFNMAVTLIRLDRVLEAADTLDQALRFGELPFTPELYQQALDYQGLVRRQLGYVDASCEQPGTRILLDGKPWFEGPGSAKVRVTTGEHTIVAERDGHLTLARQVMVSGGGTVTEKLTLVPIQTAMIVTYRHPRWIPWTVMGSGAALALGGGLGFYLAGQSRMDEFARAFLRECPNGCEEDLSMHPELADQRDAARLRYTLATSMVVLGSAVAVTGVVWALLNRPRRTLPRVEVAPTRGGVAAGASWSF